MNARPSDWPHLFALFERIAEAAPGERSGLLDEATRDRPDLRAHLQRLLELDASGSDLAADVAGWRERLAGLAAETPMPERVGAWKIVRELGVGGMGRVFLAERADGEYEQQAALKLIRGELVSAVAVARFLRERRILARLDHPGIASIVDGGVDGDGRPWFAMQHVDGIALPDYCAQRSLGLDARLRLMIGVCEAVAYAHRQLVVHCDLKPSNVLVDRNGQPRLLDFGIARMLRTDNTPHATQTQTHALTPGYAAPEQLAGKPVSVATDVYALGVMLHELLAGARPYAPTSDTPVALALAQQQGEPPPPSRVATANSPIPTRRLRGDLDLITLKALRHDPAQRYVDAAALADDLHRFLDKRPLRARRDSAAYRVRKYVQRHWIPVGATVLLVAILTGAAINAVVAQRRTEQALHRADAVSTFLLDLFRQDEPDRTNGKTLTARDLVERGAQRADTGLTDDPDTRIELLGVVGSLYSSLGDDAKAAGLRDLRLRLATQRYGAHDTRLARARIDLARSDSALEHFEPARELIRTALDGLTADDDESRGIRADGLGVLGRLERRAGHFDVASEVQRRRIGLLRDNPAGSASALANALGDLADSEYRASHFDEALASAREALGMLQSDPHAMPSEILSARDTLAQVLTELDRYPEAEALRRRNVELAGRLYGKSHPMFATQTYQLAEVMRMEGRPVESIPLFGDALAIYEKSLGSRHSYVATALTGLAQAQANSGQGSAAIANLKRAYAIYLAALGPQHLNTVIAEIALAKAQSNAGDFADAEQSYRDALTKFSGPLAAHVYAEAARQGVGEALTAQHRYAEAEPLLRQSLAALTAKFGAASDHTESAAIALASCLAGERRFDEAAAVLATTRDALEIAPPTPVRSRELDTLTAADARVTSARAAARAPVGH